MYYDQEIIDKVKDRNDIVDVIGSYISLKKKGANYVGICPFHNDSDPSLTVSRSKQIYKCFACGEAGNVFTFLMKYDNMEFFEAIKTLADRAGVELPKDEYKSYNSEKAKKYEAMREIYKEVATIYYNNLYNPEDTTGLDYFRKRGLSDQTITKFGLGYSLKNGSSLYEHLKSKGYNDEIINESMLFNYTEKYGFRDKFWNRVMFPILDKNSKVIAFGGRVMGDGEPKYLNSNETLIFDKSSNLYAYYLARRTRKDYFLLCEGYMDVIALHQAGFDNAVASLGTALTEKQAALIARCVRRVVITYDSDDAGRKAANRAIPILRAAGISTKVLNMKPYKDPDEFIKALGNEAYQERINDAVPSFTFATKYKSESYDFSNPDEKEAFINDMVGEFCRTPEPARSVQMQEFSATYNYPLDQLKTLVAVRGESMRLSGAFGKDVGYENEPSVYEPENAASAKNVKEKAKPYVTEQEKLILTWMTENKIFADLTKKYLAEEDFSPGIAQKAAGLAFEQLDSGRTVVDASSVISCFETSEEQSAVSGIFLSELWDKMEDDKAGIEKGFIDAMVKMLTESNHRRLKTATENKDGNAITEYAKRTKVLKTLPQVLSAELNAGNWQI